MASGGVKLQAGRQACRQHQQQQCSIPHAVAGGAGHIRSSSIAAVDPGSRLWRACCGESNTLQLSHQLLAAAAVAARGLSWCQVAPGLGLGQQHRHQSCRLHAPLGANAAALGCMCGRVVRVCMTRLVRLSHAAGARQHISAACVLMWACSRGSMVVAQSLCVRVYVCGAVVGRSCAVASVLCLTLRRR